MGRDPQLESNWTALMALCATEREYQTEKRHPRLLKFVSAQIDQLGKELGFSPRQIATREFRAVKSGARIVRVITE
jgi:hypothetical protein